MTAREVVMPVRTFDMFRYAGYVRVLKSTDHDCHSGMNVCIPYRGHGSSLLLEFMFVIVKIICMALDQGTQSRKGWDEA